jgi:2-polyprenyl-6-methoxyphenol hydroxylase-like FAD-dependent oxidoreductase
VPRHGSHAVVLGASLAGLAHAIPLAHRFDRVTLVDRDVLPAGAAHRPGVDQGEHVHLLVPGGVERLEALLPGVLDDLVARGGHLVPACEWRFHMGGGRLALAGSDLRITGATRPLLEAVVRDRVLALDGVAALDGWDARDLATSADGRRVVGVHLRSRQDPDDTRSLDADLVVDTTGRGSRAPRWLADLGHAPPDEEQLRVDVHYTTRLFTRRSDDLRGCRHVLVDIPAGGRRGGVAVAVEEDRWLVTLMGMVGARPPTDLDGFTDYAASLAVDDLHQIVDGATPVSEPTTRAFPSFLRRRYDRLDRLPERFVVAGDAVCSLDPRFGQGMTVALAEAMALGEVLDDHGLEQVGTQALAAAAPVVEDAWTLATGADLAHPAVAGPRSLSWRLANAWLGRLLSVAAHDPRVADAFVRVVGLLDRPGDLFTPAILLRVAAGRRRRLRGGPSDRPAPTASRTVRPHG